MCHYVRHLAKLLTELIQSSQSLSEAFSQARKMEPCTVLVRQRKAQFSVHILTLNHSKQNRVIRSRASVSSWNIKTLLLLGNTD